MLCFDKLKTCRLIKNTEIDIIICATSGFAGLQKKKYLLKEHPDNIPVMKSIKRSLDSNNIMNPVRSLILDTTFIRSVPVISSNACWGVPLVSV